VAVVQRIEEIYDCATDRISIGMMESACTTYTSELFWLTFAKNPKACKQALTNFLYSVRRLAENPQNEDVVAFDAFLRASSGQKYRSRFLLFLLLRLLFERVMEKDILKRHVLQIDPVCTDLTAEVVREILDRLAECVYLESDAQVRDRAQELLRPTGLVAYYRFMSLCLELLAAEDSEREYLAAIRTLADAKKDAEVTLNNLSQFDRLESDGRGFPNSHTSRTPDKLLATIVSETTRKNSFAPLDQRSDRKTLTSAHNNSPKVAGNRSSAVNSLRLAESRKELAAIYAEVEQDSQLNQRIRVAMVKLATK